MSANRLKRSPINWIESVNNINSALGNDNDAVYDHKTGLVYLMISSKWCVFTGGGSSIIIDYDYALPIHNKEIFKTS